MVSSVQVRAGCNRTEALGRAQCVPTVQRTQIPAVWIWDAGLCSLDTQRTTFHGGDTERCRLSSGSMNPAHAALTGILMDSCCSISLNTQAAWQGGCDVSTKGPTDVPDTATTLSSAAACSPPEPTCLSLRMGFTQTRTQESFPLLPVKWGDPGSAPTS